MATKTFTYTESPVGRTELMIATDKALVDYTIVLNGRTFKTGQLSTNGFKKFAIPKESLSNTLVVTAVPTPGLVAEDVIITISLERYLDDRNIKSVIDRFIPTIVYNTQIDRWVSNLCIRPEGFLTLGNQLGSFYGGQLKLVDSATVFNSELGTLIKFNSNQQPGYPKVFKTISANSAFAPINTAFRMKIGNSNYYTDLYSGQWQVREGAFKSYVPRDRYYLPFSYGFTGDQMIGQSMEVTMQFNPGEIGQLSLASLGYEISTGSNTI